MQTFLPYPSFSRSAAALDDRRLGKQRVEVLQILRALHLEDYGWGNHPAVLMWRGHTRALVAYGLAVVDEWCRRGHSDGTRANIAEFTQPQPPLPRPRLSRAELPPWLGWRPLHRSHRAALVRKDAAVYATRFPTTPPDLPYVWPEPPAPPPPVDPVTAWVVRASSAAVLGSFRRAGFVGLPATFDTSAATPKQRRQVGRLREVVAIGDRVVVPDGDMLVAGVFTGEVVEREAAGAAYVVRRVEWATTMPRSGLRRGYQLQDPQLLFALRGETEIAQ